MSLNGFNNFTRKNPPKTPSKSNNPANLGSIIPSSNQSQFDPDDTLINYNQKFQTATPIAFRDAIITETYAVLLANKKPNVLLVGPAGVGKTAIAEEIARQIANRDLHVPSALAKTTVYELPLSTLVSGTSLVGSLEEKLTDIIDYAENNDVILFIDEIHQLISRDSTYSKIAQILKPALARGKLRVIGATTSQESRNLLNDPAFNRRFATISVDELDKQQELTILSQALPGLLKHYNNKVDIDTSLLTNIVDLSDSILRPKTHRPDSGLTLLDRALAEAIVNRQTNIALLTKQNNKVALNAVLSDPVAHVNSHNLEKVANKIATGNSVKPALTRQDLETVLKPLLRQDRAKEKIIKMILANQLGIYSPNKPLSILLTGTSGVGKTMLSTLVSQATVGSRPITLNLTEYNSPASINRILGSPAGYVGSDSHKELPFDILDTNPYQVILLDEFEKADPAVQRLFMRVLDEGKLQLANNHEIDFSKAIIFATTNAGRSNTSISAIGFNHEEKPADSLKSYFDSELINRFDSVISFETLSRDDFIAILKQDYQNLYPKLAKKLSLPTTLPDDIIKKLSNQFYDPAFGARPAKRALESYIQNLL